MIFKVKFEDNRIDFAQAKSQLDLLQNYDSEFDELQLIEEVEELKDEAIKGETIRNTDYDEDYPENNEPEFFLLSDMVNGDDFQILASTEFD